ncbi:MAG: penicillin-binding protein 1A, partial [Pseudomonadota bacterium]
MAKIGKFRLSRRMVRFGLYGVLAMLLMGFAAAFWLWQHLYAGMPSLPSKDALWETGREQAYEFRDHEGDLITIRGPHYGRVVQINELAPHVAPAVIA